MRAERSEGTAVVTASGRFTAVESAQSLALPYATEHCPQAEFDNLLMAIGAKTALSAQLTGRGALALEAID